MGMPRSSVLCCWIDPISCSDLTILPITDEGPASFDEDMRSPVRKGTVDLLVIAMHTLRCCRTS